MRLNINTLAESDHIKNLHRNIVNFEVYRKLEHHMWATLPKGIHTRLMAFCFSGGF